MKKALSILSGILLAALLVAGCKSMNKTQKGAVIGTAGGAVAGAVIGEIAGNAQLGALIGAAVGGVAGAIIGHKMDKQAEEIKNKIPDAKVERVGEGIVIEFNDKILFGFDKSRLSADARVSLGKLVTVLKEYPDTNIEIQGHTDEKGSIKYNQALSVRRADAVSSYLHQSGLPSSRLTVKGFGESAPKYTSTTKEGNALNRRVEFLVSANEKMKADAAKEAAKESNN